MTLNRITYALILIASVAAFIITDSAAALFLSVCLIAMLPVSFLMLFIASRRLQFDYKIRESCIRGGALNLTLKAGLTPRFLVGCVKVVTDIENSTFFKINRKNFLFKDLSFTPHTFDYESADSGRISVKFLNLKLIDIFGVCSFKVKCANVAESLVAPVLYEDLLLTVNTSTSAALAGETSIPQKGTDHTEIFSIRDYSAGDTLNSVHWKLSGKFDDLKTKEFGSSYDYSTLILVDMSRKKFDSVATDEQLNTVLDVAVSVSDSLTKNGYRHSVGWFNDGVFGCHEVEDSNSFVQMVSALMSIKVNEGSAEELFYFSRSSECAGFTKVIFVTTSVSIEELKEYHGSDISVITVGDEFAELNEDGLKIINIPCDRVREALTAYEL